MKLIGLDNSSSWSSILLLLILVTSACEYEQHYSYFGTHVVTVDCAQITPSRQPEPHTFMGDLSYHIYPDSVPASLYSYRLEITGDCSAVWNIEKRHGDTQTKFFSAGSCAFEWNLCGMSVGKRFIDFYGPAEVNMNIDEKQRLMNIRIPCRISENPVSLMHQPGVNAIYEFSGPLIEQHTSRWDFH